MRTLPGAPQGVGYVSLLQVVNDRRSLEHLLDTLGEHLAPTGVRTLLGPTALSPYLGAGVLASHWQLSPPLHTPYHPPYLDERCRETMTAKHTRRLYWLELPSSPESAPGPARLSPFDPARLSGDLLELFRAAQTVQGLDLPQLCAEEAALMLELLGPSPRLAILATLDDEAVGFALLQADERRRFKRARGARGLLNRLTFKLLAKRPAFAGRLLFLAVSEAQRGKGIGRQLLSWAQNAAKAQAWRELSAGPLPAGAGAFLEAHGAHAEQRYTLYSSHL